MTNKPLTYEGCNFLRQRLVLSTLSGKPVKIKGIRSKDDNPGLKGMEFKCGAWQTLRQNIKISTVIFFLLGLNTIHEM